MSAQDYYSGGGQPQQGGYYPPQGQCQNHFTVDIRESCRIPQKYREYVAQRSWPGLEVFRS